MSVSDAVSVAINKFGESLGPLHDVFASWGNAASDLVAGDPEVWEFEDRLHEFESALDGHLPSLTQEQIVLIKDSVAGLLKDEGFVDLIMERIERIAISEHAKYQRLADENFLVAHRVNLLEDVTKQSSQDVTPLLVRRVLDEAKAWVDDFAEVGNVYRDLKNVEDDSRATQVRQRLKFCAGLLEARYKKMVRLLDDLFVQRGDMKPISADSPFGDILRRVDGVMGRKFGYYQSIIDPDVLQLRNAPYHQGVSTRIKRPSDNLQILLKDGLKKRRSLNEQELIYYLNSLNEAVGIGGAFEHALQAFRARKVLEAQEQVAVALKVELLKWRDFLR